MKIAAFVIAIIALIVAVFGVVMNVITAQEVDGVQQSTFATWSELGSYWNITDGQEWHTGLIDRVSNLENRVDALEKQQ